MIGLAAGPALAGEPVRLESPDRNLSLRLEIDHHLDRGGAWLRQRQDPATGAWGKPEDVAITALVLTVLKGIPNGLEAAPDPVIARGYDFLLSHLPGAGCVCQAEPAPEAWVRLLTALGFEAERPGVRDLLSHGIAVLRACRFSRGETEFLRREALESARRLGFSQEEIRGPAKDVDPVASAVDDRARYLQAVAWRWETQTEPDWKAWRDWARSTFLLHLQSRDIRLLEAMAKGLQASRVGRVPDTRGGEADWRELLAVRLFDLQERDGSWMGEPREGAGLDELLETTCQALLTLQTIVHSL